MTALKDHMHKEPSCSPHEIIFSMFSMVLSFNLLFKVMSISYIKHWKYFHFCLSQGLTLIFEPINATSQMAKNHQQSSSHSPSHFPTAEHDLCSWFTQYNAELNTISLVISSVNLLLVMVNFFKKLFAFVVNGYAEMHLIDLA